MTVGSLRRLLPVLLLLAGCGPSGTPDFDGDGIADAVDCGVSDPDVYTGAPDPWSDGIDQNCDGLDGTDGDDDGWPRQDPAMGPDDLFDCDDSNAAFFPGQTEIPDNEWDEDCDGVALICDADSDGWVTDLDLCPSDHDAPDCDDFAGSCSLSFHCLDDDGDGVRVCDGDCADDDPLTSPAASELCDGLDNDCDAVVPADEADADGDGFRGCDGDCEDEVDTAWPGAPEVCDGLGVDSDCGDGLLFEGEETDGDGDGAAECEDCDDGDASLNLQDSDGDGESSCAGDCDDEDPLRASGNADPIDGINTNCDDVDGVDGDGDGLAAGIDDCNDADAACGPIADCLDADGDGFQICQNDCDDDNPAANPAAVEVCDGFDTDCDGVGLNGGDEDADGDGDPFCDDCDDGDPALSTLDVDGDGQSSCDGDCFDDIASVNSGSDLDADGWFACDGGDCNDFNPSVNPDAPEQCDGLDNDCDGSPGADEGDGDGDTFVACQDCDDADAAVFPFAPEQCNGVDDDCDGAVPTDEVDVDLDDYVACAGWSGDASLASGDCEPFAPEASPVGVELCDGLDNDCNGQTDELGDGDGDGWCVTDCSTGICLPDCDDSDPAAYLGSWLELDGDGIDSSCDWEDWFALTAADVVMSGTGLATGLPHPGFGANLGEQVLLADFDGDGFDDALLTAPGDDAPGNSTGSAWLFLAPTLATVAALDPADADVVFEGTSGGGDMGEAASVGDLDGDGLADLLLGAADAVSQRGRVYVFTGATLLLTPPAGAGQPWEAAEADMVIAGEDMAGKFGTSVAAGGDFDGDGLGDLLVGARTWSGVGSLRGRAYLVRGADLSYGSPSASETPVLDVAWATIDGGIDGDTLGTSSAWVGDYDGDGLDDAVVGADLADPTGNGSGGAWLFSSASLGLGVALSVADADVTLLGATVTSNSDFGEIAIGGFDLDGDGLSELAVSMPEKGSSSNGTLPSVYLWRGATLAASPGSVDPSDAWIELTGLLRQTGGSSYFGGGLATGDIDGDGVPDLLVGAREEDTQPTSAAAGDQQGRVRWYPGSSLAALPDGTVLPATGATNDFGGTLDFAWAGAAVTTGDVDADGRDDILVGAPYDSEQGVGTGKGYLLISPF